MGEKKKEEESGDLATGLDYSQESVRTGADQFGEGCGRKPVTAAVHLALGTCQLAMDNRTGALKATVGLWSCVRISLAHFGLAEVYRLEGDRDRAKSHYNSYLASSGEDRNGAYDDQARNRLGVLGN